MDVLSSQSNLAGYRSVVESIYEFEQFQWWWQQRNSAHYKSLVIGAGVAGLQAVATAKRLGAIVSATDVRQASKEQVESLVGNLSVEQKENLETEGGCKRQAKNLKNKLTYSKKLKEMILLFVLL